MDGDPTEADLHWLRQAIELSRRCPPSDTAFSVGALVVDEDGTVLSDGWSRRDDPHEHAEEAALAGLTGAHPGATVYSSLEPCSARASRPLTCTGLILDSGLRRVVFAWREPAIFVDCDGAEQLREAGLTVIEVPSLAPLVRKVNAHLPSTDSAVTRDRQGVTVSYGSVNQTVVPPPGVSVRPISPP